MNVAAEYHQPTQGRPIAAVTKAGSRTISASGQLHDALAAASPRYSPISTPWPSLLIHGGLAALWLLLFARAFGADGIFAWSVGIAYVSYDTLLLAFVFWQTLRLLRPVPPPDDAVVRPPVSLAVIVAAHNEAAVLPATLAALFAQTEPADLIVVADDGSSDETPALLQSRFGLARPAAGLLSAPGPWHSSLRWLPLPHGGKPAALNAAFVLIDTELVLTVDADTLLDPAAIAAMRAAFAADSSLVAATGILAPVCGPGASGRLFQWFQTYEYMRNFLSRYAWMRMGSLLLISGAFAAFRRHAVLAVGGFDPASLVEDYELIHRLRRHGVGGGLGWTTAVVGASRAITDAPESIPAFLRQRRRWFGGFLRTQFWYRDMVGNPAYGRLGLMMLPVKAADTLQPIYGLTALGLLLAALLRGQLPVAVLGVIGVKLAIDVAFQVWSIRLYRRWAAPGLSISLGSGLLATLLEPFTFQILRHLGAALGWIVFATGDRTWGTRRRVDFAVGREPRDT